MRVVAVKYTSLFLLLFHCCFSHLFACQELALVFLAVFVWNVIWQWLGLRVANARFTYSVFTPWMYPTKAEVSWRV